METQTHLPLQQMSVKGTSFFRTCLNGFNALAGVGLLSLPFAVSQGGWLSLSLLFLLAIIFLYTGLLLQRCMEGSPNVKTYPDIGALAFGNKGRAAVSTILYLELYCLAVEFLILEGDNLEKIFPHLGFKVGQLEIRGKKLFVPLSALVVLPTTWLNLGLLAYVSFGGVLVSGVLLLCVAWIGAVDGIGLDLNQREALLKLQGLPTTLSLFAYCYCGHSIFPMLSNSMKDKSQFPKVLMVCFATSTVTYGAMGVMGYLMYGANTASQITLNLPLQNMGTKIAICAAVINPLTKYATMTSPITYAMEAALGDGRMMRFSIRTVLVLSTAVVALAIPFFAYVVAFTGASLSMTTSILIPCLCYLKISKATKRFGMEWMVIAVILVMGFSISFIGTYSSVKEIVSLLVKG